MTLASNIFIMRNLFQGGECGPSGVEASTNQFKAMVDMMMLGNQNPEKMMEFANNTGVNFEQEIMKRKMDFEKMKQVWIMEGTHWLSADQALMAQGANMEQHMKVREHQHRQAIESINQVEAMKQRTMVFNAEQMIAMQQMMAINEMKRQQMMAMDMQRHAALHEQ